MGREGGGGIGMGKTCEPKAFSFQCMTKSTTNKKKKKKEKKSNSSPDGVGSSFLTKTHEVGPVNTPALQRGKRRVRGIK